MPTLFDSLKLGALMLPNRVIMAPLTRMRSSQPGNIPNELMATYYAQRAGAGLIISEATQVSPQGQGYPATPGIHSAAHVAGWRQVTHAVHQAGGRMFLQLWHVGRISHESHQPGGGRPVAPSALAPKDSGTFSADWKPVACPVPRALALDEIPGIVTMFADGAKNAKEAGFDGVEVHGANGYLLDQFLQDSSNVRTDAYGGSIENRARLLLEVVDAVTNIWGAGRVGVRLSPYGTFNDMRDSDPVALFSYVLAQLSARKISYAHIIEPRASGAGGSDGVMTEAPETRKVFRAHFTGTLISAGGYDREDALAAIETGEADAVAFGRSFIANPDLPERLKMGAALNPYNRKTFYGGGAEGYTDYPTLTQSAAA